MATETLSLNTGLDSMRIIGGSFGSRGWAIITDGVINIQSAAKISYSVEDIQDIRQSTREMFRFNPWGLAVGMVVVVFWSHFFGIRGLLASIIFAGLCSIRRRDFETVIIRFPHNIWMEVIGKPNQDTLSKRRTS